MLRTIPLLLAIQTFAQLGLAQDPLDPIRRDWQARKYPETYAATEVIRKQPYGKALEVYYMGGTSLCRMPNSADQGVKYMQWIMDRFQLSATDRTTVRKELHSCQDNAAATTVPVTIAFNTPRASSGGSTKMFYYVSDNNALKSVPVEIIKPMAWEEFAKRLFPASQRAQARDAIARLAGPKAAVEASKYFIVASGFHSAQNLRSIGQQLDSVYEFFLKEYNMPAPESLISVYAVRDAQAMSTLSAALHGIRLSPQSIGYSYRDDMSMVGIVPDIQIGTLQHELFHLMVRNDFGDVPPWLDEGMAALYEVSAVTDGRIIGVPNWRGRVLHDLGSKQPTVEQMIKMNWFDFSGGDKDFDTERQAVIHAKARYFILYLQNKSKLGDVYQAFRLQPIGGDSVELLKTVLKKDLGGVEKDFQSWFQKLPQ